MANTYLPIELMSKISQKCDNTTLSNLFESYIDVFDYEKERYCIVEKNVNCKCISIKFDKNINDVYETEKFIRLVKRTFAGFDISSRIHGVFTKVISFHVCKKYNGSDISINILDLHNKCAKFKKYNIIFDVVMWYPDIDIKKKKMIIRCTNKFLCADVMTDRKKRIAIAFESEKISCIFNFCETSLCKSKYEHYYHSTCCW